MGPVGNTDSRVGKVAWWACRQSEESPGGHRGSPAADLGIDRVPGFPRIDPGIRPPGDGPGILICPEDTQAG